MGRYDDFEIELRTGERLVVRAPTLDDQESVMGAISDGAEPPTDPKDPRAREITWRILHRCVRWPEGIEPAPYEEFRRRLPLGEIVRNQSRINAFFGSPEIPSATSAASSASG